MVVAHNLLAMNANRMFTNTEIKKKKSTERLSSGYRINRAADDAAGLTISEKMRSLIRGLNQGSYNIQDGISLIQVADGALSGVHSILHRMNELAVKSANGTNTDADRGAIQKEISACIGEIDRIGKSTTFNTMHIFDDVVKQIDEGAITNLVSSPGADSGYLTEAYKDSATNKYYPAASLDFSGVDASNIYKLNNGSFTFNCSQDCSEVFDVTFKTDGTPSSTSNLSGRVHHYYVVDIKDCKNGTEVVNTIMDYVKTHLPTGNSAGTSELMTGVKVSHSNNLIADGTKLWIASNSNGKTTESAAKRVFPSSVVRSGKISYTELLVDKNESMYDFSIQCSNNKEDNIVITTQKMNAAIIGIDSLDVSTQDSAKSAIKKVENAIEAISDRRSRLGAFQNRLEHAFNNVNNIAENTTAAESRIRDTDMAKETIEFTKFNILSQAGISMMTQANQSTQGVVQLLNV